ncbi:MAG TPA: hypothetical protein VEL76_04340 [Gemmataceae bacterium]|nr:hypothetical protein [Gemmataceae bacterium]
MRYFTRQLYQQFNSAEDAEADRAEQAWETALEEYRQHRDGLRDRMPSNVSKLADLNLHDAEILSRTEEIQPGAPFIFPEFPFPLPIALWSAVAIVSVRLGGDVVSLIYCLWDRIREDPAPDDWPFSKLREHWLYDEVDIGSERRGPFLHRILLSSGVELEIPFTTVVIHRFAVHPSKAGKAEPQSA